MAYVLRFVQTYAPASRPEFMELEAKFAALERSRGDLPAGRRLQPCAGGRHTNTLIWEARFETLADVEQALAKLGTDPDHEALYAEQSRYILQAFTEIDEVLEL